MYGRQSCLSGLSVDLWLVRPSMDGPDPLLAPSTLDGNFVVAFGDSPADLVAAASMEVCVCVVSYIYPAICHANGS